MKKIVVIILLMLLSVPGLAAGEEGAGTGGKRDARPQKETAGRKAENQPRQAAQGNATWPRTFVPAEKINADTAVSFPADI